MLVDREDLERACVAAITFRQHHPKWSLWLFVRGALPAPWKGLSACCFDRRISMHSLLSNLATQSKASELKHMRDLEIAFASIFKEGVFVATYIDYRHVWFGSLYSLGFHEINPTIWTTRSVSQNLGSSNEPIVLSMRAGDDVKDVMSRYAGSDHAYLHDPRSSNMTPSESNFILGLNLDDLQRKQLRFDSEGFLRLDEMAVLSVRFDKQHDVVSSRTPVDTVWMEIEKWFFSKLDQLG